MSFEAERPLLEIRGMSKAFPGVQALSGVDLDVRAGEVHAVVGENGAGKSTLMKIVAGVYHSDSGTILLGGQPMHNDSPRQALERGISMIHQELNLAPNLSVAENVFLWSGRLATAVCRRRSPGSASGDRAGRSGACRRAQRRAATNGRNRQIPVVGCARDHHG
jgi:ABC-type sugar transport system ATPase subunit